MTIISDNWTNSRISTFSGETASNNADNKWFRILNYCKEVIPASINAKFNRKQTQVL